MASWFSREAAYSNPDNVVLQSASVDSLTTVSHQSEATEDDYVDEIMNAEVKKESPISHGSADIHSNGSDAIQQESLSDLYMKQHQKFLDWRESENVDEHNFSQEVLFNYFTHLQSLKIYNPNTLLYKFYYLKTSIKRLHNVDCSYAALESFLKENTAGFVPQKTTFFENEHMTKFLSEAPDEDFLAMKVILIFAMNGVCKADYFIGMASSDVKEHGEIIVVKISGAKTFSLEHEHAAFVRKYMNLRSPRTIKNSFFLNYRKGKCDLEAIGRGQFLSAPKKIAKFLRLSNADNYTLASLRRKSGADPSTLKRHTERVSTAVTEECQAKRIKMDVPAFSVTTNQVDCSQQELESIGSNHGEATNTEWIRRSTKIYNSLRSWKESEKIDIEDFSENVLIAYFTHLQKSTNPSSLVTMFHYLKRRLQETHNINVNYPNLYSLLKQNMVGYQVKKATDFESEQFRKFLLEAPDKKFLLAKVVVIFIVIGANSEELTKMTINDVKEHGAVILVKINGKKSTRSFTLENQYAAIVRKYMNLRPVQATTNRFFLKYDKGKCTKAVIGQNKLKNFPKIVANYLQLPDAANYIFSSFRNISLDGDLATLKRSDAESITKNDKAGFSQIPTASAIQKSSTGDIKKKGDGQSSSFEFIELNEMKASHSLETESNESDDSMESDEDVNDIGISRPKTVDRYFDSYKKFMEWKKNKSVDENDFSEDIILGYFEYLVQQKYQYRSLEAIFCKLKAMIQRQDNVHIDYPKVKSLLKEKSVGYIPKKAFLFKPEHLRRFLLEAPDDDFLASKVVAIFFVNGIPMQELTKVSMNDVNEHGDIFLIKTGDNRPFTIENKYATCFRKYMSLRRTIEGNNRLFLHCHNGKCNSLPMGRNVFLKIPKVMADFLDLPDSEIYTSRSFRLESLPSLDDVSAGTSHLSLKVEGLDEVTASSESKALSEDAKVKYFRVYKKFMEWKETEGFDEDDFSVQVFLDYYKYLEYRQNYKSSSLRTNFQMIKKPIEQIHKIDINYPELLSFLKETLVGYFPKKANIFEQHHLKTFLSDAPDDDYLLMKVALIFIINGAGRPKEMLELTLNDVKEHGEVIVIKTTATKTKNVRSFTVENEHAALVRKYMNMRPADTKTNRFFLRYRKMEKCSTNPIGEAFFKKISKHIANFLDLPDEENYFFSSIRQSSTNLWGEGVNDVNPQNASNVSNTSNIVDSTTKKTKKREIRATIAATEENDDNDSIAKRRSKRVTRSTIVKDEILDDVDDIGVDLDTNLVADVESATDRYINDTMDDSNVDIKDVALFPSQIELLPITKTEPESLDFDVFSNHFEQNTVFIKKEIIENEETDDQPPFEFVGLTSDIVKCEVSSPNETHEEANNIEIDLPEKSRDRYLKEYNQFLNWKESQEINKENNSETVWIAYLAHLQQTYKPASLLNIFSSLRTTVQRVDNADINHPKLRLLLKEISAADSQIEKKSNIFAPEHINRFLSEAPDEEFLLHKVYLIFGINGVAKSQELMRLTVDNIKQHGEIVLVKIPRLKSIYSFTIESQHAACVRKYMNHRPATAKSNRFFLYYQKKRFDSSPIGRNVFLKIPKDIATFLNLPDAENYTCTSMRSTSVAALNDAVLNARDSDLKGLQQEPCEDVVSAGEFASRKSGEKQLNIYRKFMNWKESKQVDEDNFSETILLAYLTHLQRKLNYKASSLSAIYSTLVSKVKQFHDVKINYPKINSFLKQQSAEHIPIKPNVFEPEHIGKFLLEAPDDNYLTFKAILIFCMSGVSKSRELMKMTINDVEQHGEVIYIKVREENTKVKRSFTIESQYAAYVRKYLKRRQAFATTNHLFINCQKGRFQNVPIGRNKFIKIPKTIANFLHLPDPIKYTLASFRQKSASNLDSIASVFPTSCEIESSEPVEETVDIGDIVLPDQSRGRYLQAYQKFVSWKKSENIDKDNFSEAIFLDYFTHLQIKHKYKESSLLTTYSMLKATIERNDNVDINYPNLYTFIKENPIGIVGAKVPVFEPNHVRRFLLEAPDEEYLFAKVFLIFDMSKAGGATEQTKLTINDVNEHGDVILIKQTSERRKDIRLVTIEKQYAPYVRKYMNLRPATTTTDRFFLKYENGQCTTDAVGRTKLLAIPKVIASFLKLPDADSYSSKSIRRSSIPGAVKPLQRKNEKRTTGVTQQFTGATAKNSNFFEPTHIKRFLLEASDFYYLLSKVILIFGINRTRHPDELMKVTVNDVTEHGDIIFIKITGTKSKVVRSFTVENKFAAYVRQYMKIRLATFAGDRFFLNYHMGTCTPQPIDRHQFLATPKNIANFLALPNAEKYTCYSFQRTSPNLLDDADDDSHTVKVHGNWTSTSTSTVTSTQSQA